MEHIMEEAAVIGFSKELFEKERAKETIERSPAAASHVCAMGGRKSCNKGNNGMLQAMADGAVFAGQCECGAGSTKRLF